MNVPPGTAAFRTVRPAIRGAPGLLRRGGPQSDASCGRLRVEQIADTAGDHSEIPAHRLSEPQAVRRLRSRVHARTGAAGTPLGESVDTPSISPAVLTGFARRAR